MTSQNLRISELPDASSIQMDDFLPIARKLGESDKRATKKLLMEDLLNGIKNEIDFTDIIEEYITININKFNGLIKEVYLGKEKLKITKEGVLVIPDKFPDLEQRINNLSQTIVLLNNLLNEVSQKTITNEKNINNLKTYVDNEYFQKIVDLINNMLNNKLGYLEVDVFFINNLINSNIYIKDEGFYKIVQCKTNLPTDLINSIGVDLPMKTPGTYLIYDLSNSLFSSLLTKYTNSILYELTNNTSENGVKINSITGDNFYFPVHANVFFNNNTKKLIYFFQETFSFQGLLYIK